MATTQADAVQRLLAAFVAGWGATSAYVIDDEPFNPPSTTSWARISIRHAASEQETLGASGSRKFSRSGTIFVQCFTPLVTGGSAQSQAMAEVARGIFEGKHFLPESIRTEAADCSETGASGSWYLTTMSVPFAWTETK